MQFSLSQKEAPYITEVHAFEKKRGGPFARSDAVLWSVTWSDGRTLEPCLNKDVPEYCRVDGYRAPAQMEWPEVAGQYMVLPGGGLMRMS